MDWSTLGHAACNPRSTTPSPPASGNFYDPTHHIFLTPNWPGWTCDEEIQQPQAAAGRGDGPEEALRAVGAADEAVLREGAGRPLRRPLRAARASARRVKGFNDKTERPRFWGLDREVARPERAAGVAARRRPPRRSRDHVPRAPNPRRAPRDGGGRHGGLSPHPPHPRRSRRRHARPGRDPGRSRPPGAQLGLDRPCTSSSEFYGRVLQGDLGRSYFLNRPVTQALRERAEPTLAPDARRAAGRGRDRRAVRIVAGASPVAAGIAC